MNFRLRQSLLLLLLFCTGCAAGGVVWFKAFGPAKVAAKYEPLKQSTLVLVENYHNPALTEFDADEISRGVVEELKKNDVVPVIDVDKLNALRDADHTKYAAMTIPAIGKAVGAKQVIYVDLIEAGVETDPSQSAMRGQAVARVRLVDVESGNTLWPLDSPNQGYSVGAELPYSQGDASTAVTMHGQLITSLSSQIAKLFYAWKPESQAEGDAG